MAGKLKDNLTRGETWERLLHTLLFAFICGVAALVLAAVVALQLGFVLLTARRNANLQALGAGIARFAYEVLMYITCNSDERPFPFGEWPGAAGFPRAAYRDPGGARPARRRRAPRTRAKKRSAGRTADRGSGGGG